MQAMIFSAGLGTRFKPWTDSHPKALALVNGKSLLQRNIEYLQKYGIKDIIVNVHHFAEQIEAAIVENDGWGSNILVSDERDELPDTGGGLLKAKDFFTPEGKLSGKLTGLTRWYTNLDTIKRHQLLILYKKYSEEEYPHYDNLDAIDVSKTAEIPEDYNGYMGVPDDLLDNFNPVQFEQQQQLLPEKKSQLQTLQQQIGTAKNTLNPFIGQALPIPGLTTQIPRESMDSASNPACA